MSVSILSCKGMKDISDYLLDENNVLKLFPASHYGQYEWNDFRAFCHFKARYGIVTTELVDFLKEQINGRSVIEIGSGAGDLGTHMQIQMTDNKQQELATVRKQYELMQQPVIQYHPAIDKLDALDAVRKYKPQVVVGMWITTYAPKEMPYGSNPMGIKEPEILDLVDTFILIGYTDSHADKPIMKKQHDEYYFDWLISRGRLQENNRIWIWNK